MKDPEKPIIEVTGLSKRYIIDHEQKAQYGSLRDNLAAFVKKPFEKRGQKLSGEEAHEEFWALKDVSFSVNKGEIFGVIGRNGSGKSTLLKTLSRIISPTDGTAVIRGKTASLLEVGTGFHPELTGRENVFFNGSMLGMTKDEIGKKFDEIVKFAEIEKFLDTPVKFYSSGMYVRLAFSVAAHLEPDVLILDEVLAVGDSRFQEKSMRKIMSTIESGTTVLFVSHSMDAVKKICSRGLLLQDGQVAYVGNTSELVDRYNILNLEERSKKDLVSSWEGNKNKEFLTINSLHISSKQKTVLQEVAKSDDELQVNIKFTLTELHKDFVIGYAIESEGGSLLYMSYSSDTTGLKDREFTVGEQTITGSIPSHLLNDGSYKITVIASVFNKYWLFEYSHNDSPSIYLVVSGGLSHEKLWPHAREGMLAPKINWNMDEVNAQKND